MKWLYEKPKGMTYTDLCIWIDKNFYEPDCDYNTAYKYMWILAMMLACKSKYFNNVNDYQNFASYLAYATYERMIDPSKPKLKSVLNYMKSIQYFRKNAYQRETYARIIDPDYDSSWNGDLFIENYKTGIESTSHHYVEMSMLDVLAHIPTIIKESIPKVFRADKVNYENIYMSCLLTMINGLTLSNDHKERLKSKEEDNPCFNEASYYKKYLDDEIILWHLPDSMETVVRVVINKTNSKLVSEIRSLSDSIKISDDEFSHIIFSELGGGNNTHNEAN